MIALYGCILVMENIKDILLCHEDSQRNIGIAKMHHRDIETL